jgi:anaerobic dimethyl sulfoxide reductase subunit C (anchor subunit)
VPQFDARLGIMTKCDFCYGNLEAGLPPSCVAACPLRVLDYGTMETLEKADQSQNLWQLPASTHPYPLPNYSRTEPHLAVTPHAGMCNSLGKEVSNQEEVLPPGAFENQRGRAGIHELSLLGFTLFLQMAIGLAVFGISQPTLGLNTLLAIGILLAAGGLVALLHIGRKRNAWRAVIHLKKSWLSREILLAGLFSLTWVAAAVSQWTGKATSISWLMAVLGISLLYSMARIYLLRAVPSWNSWRTPVAFTLSAAILGAVGINLYVPNPGYLLAAMIAMAVEIVLVGSERHTEGKHTQFLRIILLGIAMLGALLAVSFHQVSSSWLSILIFAIALAAEILGRWQFYASRKPFPMNSY